MNKHTLRTLLATRFPALFSHNISQLSKVSFDLFVFFLWAGVFGAAAVSIETEDQI
jgi:hypothetical protein